ncbi:hypothetical protein [Rossellomorea marisflavi]|uniref:hypothetical protein n=1 Tax=Rossellomorea marisflavi TaxID=189381 RepID=UPI001EE28182|nr:hypothetical protein [Rossellomorea marisflavi]UKS63665.1 hypothetical protein K6T23_12395 [Rossellomorea marisflavi]
MNFVMGEHHDPHPEQFPLVVSVYRNRIENGLFTSAASFCQDVKSGRQGFIMEY